MRSSRFPAAALLVTACASQPDACEIQGESLELPGVVREASGVALSRQHPDILWVHNDSDGGSNVFAIDLSGNLVATVPLASAQNRDWEDIAVAPCPAGGPDGDCIYVADIGDNRAARPGIGLWLIPEPDPRAPVAAAETGATAFIRLHYPDGARDAEAIAVTDAGDLLLVTKGREHPVALYRANGLRWPTDSSATPVELELVQQLTDAAVDLPEQVTGASLVPQRDGRVLALRSYGSVRFYRVTPTGLQPDESEPFPLDTLAEPQGEGIAVSAEGDVFLVSEAGPQAIAPRLNRLRCPIP